MAGKGLASMAKMWMRCLSLFSALYSKAPPPPPLLTHGMLSPFRTSQHARSAERSAVSPAKRAVLRRNRAMLSYPEAEMGHFEDGMSLSIDLLRLIIARFRGGGVLVPPS